MPTVKIPLFGAVYKNVDGVELNDAQEILIDGYLSDFGGTVKRPGLAAFLDLNVGSSSVDGLFWWSEKSCAVAVCGGRLFRVDYPSGVAVATSLDDAGLLSRRIKPSFAPCSGSLFIATGGQIVHSDGVTAAARITDADAPTTAIALGSLDGYLLAVVSNSSRFYFADFNAPTSWTSTSYANAESSTDYNKTLIVHGREVLLLGQKSLEVWENDGATPFARVAGGVIEVGCLSGASVITTDRGVFWLSDKRRIVQWSGGAVKRLSTPYDREIESYSSPETAIGQAIEIDGKLFLTWQFLGDSKMLVCNLEKETPDWSEWANWDSARNKYLRWQGASYCYCPDWGVHLVGSAYSSTIYALSRNNYTDAGSEIRLLRRTGHIDYGTSKRKVCRGMRFRVKRGAANGGVLPKLSFRFKDDGRYWSNEHHVSLGAQGETEHIARIWPGGIYRTRQYEFCCTDSVPITFLDAEEDIEVLSS